MQTLHASSTPYIDIEQLTYKGQDPKRRMYHPGYENFFNAMPMLLPDDPFLKEKIALSKKTMQSLSERLKPATWLSEMDPGEDSFQRSIVSLEKPIINSEGVHEGYEFVVAHWGNGFTSPVHGHAHGYMHEELITGKMRVNTYRRLGKTKTVRLVKTEIYNPGTIVSLYSEPGTERDVLVHNFTSIGFSNSLHFLPEHTRDGRDNRFDVEYFNFDLKEHVIRIASKDGLYLRKGDVLLVRSENVPEYSDHFIVITGQPIVKEHGLRPQDVAIIAPQMKAFLDSYEPRMGLILLKLDAEAREAFLEFHNIKIQNGEVVIPQI